LAKSKVERYYDKHASQYSPGEFSPSNLAGDLYFANMITWHFFRKYVPKRKSCLILEAGAGTGDWPILFAKLGYRNFVLADISQGMLKQAERKFAKLSGRVNVRYVKADIADMKPLESNMFDHVFSQFDAVSLSLRPKQAMRELARVAKRHAYVIVTVDTKYTRVPDLIEAGRLKEAEQLLKSNISYEYDDWHDFRFPSYNLTWEELARYFEKAGLGC
jgi:ubiquinone/menaquinone biosynthesis C-methylase UbiE